MSHSPLLDKHLTHLQHLYATRQSSVLDLACGNGRNGLFLVEHNIATTFADIKDEALDQITQSLSNLETRKQQLAHCWQIDFEQDNTTPLQGKSFAAIMVFRYLHRSLFEQIKEAIVPGGMIIYETFTEQQAEFGRPKNPDYLLKPNELTKIFADWKILHSFEGVVEPSTTNNIKQAIAQIVAVKPIQPP